MYPIPNLALDDRLAFVGTSGSGKTYAASAGVEILLQRGARCVVIDPLGVWYGLRLSPDGSSASGLRVVIFGGPHGDLALTEHAGTLIGKTVATMAESCIIDLSELPTKSAERRFMLGFLDSIYRTTNPKEVDPYHIIFDEADLWAPQKSSEPMLQSRMEEIVRRGRIKGFTPWLITQRPAVLSKDVLSQADGMVAMQLTSSQDRDAVGGWIEGQADRAQGKSILASLPTMQKGQGVIWLPARGILKTEQFPEKKTFDSSRTPKRGEKRAWRTLAPLDIAALKGKLATVEEETKANDPAALKAEIFRLKAEIKNPDRAHAQELEIAVRNATAAGREAGIIEGRRAAVQSLGKFAHDLSASVERACSAAGTLLSSFASFVDSLTTEVPTPPAPSFTGEQLERMKRAWDAGSAGAMPRPLHGRTPVIEGVSRRTGNGHLPPGELAVLTAALQFDGIERAELTVLTGYKRSSRDQYIQRLQTKGLVQPSGPYILATDAGRKALPDFTPLPTGRELQQYWLNRLPEGERAILTALLAVYPNAVKRTELDEITGYKRSSRDQYLQRMKAKRLWEEHAGDIRAAEGLF